MQTLDQYLRSNPAATGDEVRAAFPARTAAPIMLQQLRPWMDNLGLTRRLARTIESPVFAGVVASAGQDLVAVQDAAGGALDFFNSPHNTQLDTDSTAVDPITGKTYFAKTVELLGLMVACHGQDDTLGMPQAIADAFVGFGGDVLQPPTDEEIDAARAAVELADAKNARMSAIETWASQARAAVNAATSVDTLPEVPTP